MLIGGQEDPIGNFGKGIEEVHRYLEDSCHRVEMRLYKGMRHNICDEVRKEAVYIDILQWMKLHLNCLLYTSFKGRRSCKLKSNVPW